MGACCAKTERKRLLLLGLDLSGKTAFTYKLKTGENVATVPTIGFNVEYLQVNNYTFSTWDVGGQWGLRALWRHYLPGTAVLIFMVDSTDTRRLDDAHSALKDLLKEDELSKTLFVVACNKQDKEDALHCEEIGDQLQVFEYVECNVSFFDSLGRGGTLLARVPDGIIGVIASYLPKIRNGRIYEQTIGLFECSVLTGEGLSEIMEWIVSQL